jgi:ubiquitin C-terminal hydrolase
MKKNIQIIKLPEIFIFTLNRKNNKQINRIKIFADDIIEMKIYIDKKSTEAKRTTYKLFALNILIDNEHGYKHQIKMNEEWYEFYNDLKKIITNPDFSDSIYGLYYKRI